MVHTVVYILELLDRGHSLEFIAKDADVQVASIVRRLKRAEKMGELSKYHSAVLRQATE